MAEKVITVEGIVQEVLPNGLYRIKLDQGNHEIIGNLKGKLRLYNIRIIKGDRVTVEISPYDLTKGRVVFRNKV